MEFEKHLKELENLADKMSSGQIGLNESLETFKQGMKLIEKCRKEISQAEQSVKKLIKVNESTGEIETENFQALEEEKE